jgi:protein-disulfide isomerase-like protein with CxxC motif
VLLGQQEAGDAWHVRWLAFSLNQTKVAEGATAVWDDPGMAATRLPTEVGIAVRDGWPEVFPRVHRALFAARHDKGLDLRQNDVVADVLVAEGLDPDQVFDEVLSGRPRDVFRIEHGTAVSEHKVFGVPTVISEGQAVFVRVVDRPHGDTERALRTVERCLNLVTGWPDLNEFKHTTIPR